MKNEWRFRKILKFVDDNLPSTPGIAKHILVSRLEDLVEECIRRNAKESADSAFQDHVDGMM